MSRSLVARVRDLRLRKGRERRGLALAEGIRLVEEALAARLAIRHALASPALEASPRGRRLQAELTRAGVEIEPVAEKLFSTLTATDQPQGVLAVVELPRWSLADVAVGPARPVLVLDGVQDPGNVGTMIRTAFGLGGAGVLALPGTAELANPKTLRATMGAAFRIPVVGVGEPALRRWAEERRVEVWLAEPGPRWAGPPAGPVAIVLGNEGAGIRPSLAAWARGSVGIPLRPGAESLNVAVAAGILLYEVTRG